MPRWCRPARDPVECRVSSFSTSNRNCSKGVSVKGPDLRFGHGQRPRMQGNTPRGASHQLRSETDAETDVQARLVGSFIGRAFPCANCANPVAECSKHCRTRCRSTNRYCPTQGRKAVDSNFPLSAAALRTLLEAGPAPRLARHSSI